MLLERGIGLTPEVGAERVDLMCKADTALYRNKEEGRRCYRYFETSLDEPMKLRATIEEELRATLETGDRLKVFYRPEFAAAAQSIIGLESWCAGSTRRED